MSELVADCPRCGSKKITFDLTQQHHVRTRYNWQRWYEAFCVCRHCGRSTVFVLSQNTTADTKIVHENGLLNLTGSVNGYMDIEGCITLKDFGAQSPPEHLPEDIKVVFEEGAKCLAVDCYNAAGTMFRLCLDLATRSKLPSEEIEGLNAKTRRTLGLRLPWMFDHGLLPEALKELSSCVKDDGNDGAHAGTLGKPDAEDLLEFTVALLERLYTEPEQLRLAKLRREKRHQKPGTEQ